MLLLLARAVLKNILQPTEFIFIEVGEDLQQLHCVLMVTVVRKYSAMNALSTQY